MSQEQVHTHTYKQVVKTITCHEVYNHGASLQEYALLKYLDDLGCDAKTLHYKPDYLSKHFNLWAISNPKYGKNFILKYAYLLLKLPGRLKDLTRKRNFDAFAKKYIPTDETLYHTNEDLKKNLPSGDAFICGSDQIWNSFFQNGKDPAFYLDFVPDHITKISYAPSFAITHIADDLKPFVSEKVARLDSISVRETSGVDILEEVGIEGVVQVLDPVFLVAPSYWKETFVFPISEDYIFIYDFDSNATIRKTALRLAQEHHWNIYSVNKNISYADKNFWLEGPEHFLSLVANANLVLSNSFHAVCFSIIFKKQLYVFNRTEKINTRMQDLLGLMQLDVLITEEDTAHLGIHPIKEYDEVHVQLEKHINRSKKFLKNALKLENSPI